MVGTRIPWKKLIREHDMTANDNSDSSVLPIVDKRKIDELRRTTNQVGVSILCMTMI